MPKHAFIAWLAALKTWNHIKSSCIWSLYAFEEKIENTQRMMFRCPYSRKYNADICSWLGVRNHEDDCIFTVWNYYKNENQVESLTRNY